MIAFIRGLRILTKVSELKIGAKVKFGSSNRLERDERKEKKKQRGCSRRVCCHSSLSRVREYGGGARLDTWMKKYMLSTGCTRIISADCTKRETFAPCVINMFLSLCRLVQRQGGKEGSDSSRSRLIPISPPSLH